MHHQELHQGRMHVFPCNATVEEENPVCIEKSPIKLHKSVKFVDRASVQIIENAKEAYTRKEMSDMYYTRQDMQRWKRLCKALAEDLSFYTDEELWDRFAVRSKAQQQTRRRIRWALRCVVESLKENQNCFQELSGNGTDSESDDGSCQSDSSLDSTLEEYYRICQACSQVALDRALRIEQQLMVH
ncbi:hypothetical protein IV203_001469 [Nitzschia inconspicua]|uniref:Uncharacterized protein n=1 Tax=Nitzschia inconspicua TaxID=303405 RepID=A0A9K3L7D1_9STRA|nr:hypothetical protein IV203_001469 [Nitzschia inconspicua]